MRESDCDWIYVLHTSGVLMLIKKAAEIRSSEITPKSLYLNRRKFLAGAAMAGAAAVTGIRLAETVVPSVTVLAGNKIDGVKKSPFSTTETVTPYKDVTHYNNYYEFSTDKEGPPSRKEFPHSSLEGEDRGWSKRSRNSMSTRSSRWRRPKSGFTAIAV